MGLFMHGGMVQQKGRTEEGREQVGRSSFSSYPSEPRSRFKRYNHSLSDFSSSAFLPALRSTARVLAMNACLREVAVGRFEPQVLELCIGKSLMSEKTI